MRIARFEIDGFGLFRDARVDDLAPGLAIFAGDNEAGKSTLVGFLRTMLFGFPRKNATAERQYPPFAGGDEGGRLVLVTDSGDRWTIERFRRAKGLRVTGPDGESTATEPGTLLFPGVTRELFANIYAFGLDELQEVATLEGDAVRTAIFGAASGAAVTSLPATFKAIEKTGQELFKPGGSTPEINRLLGELESVRKQLSEARKEIGAYEQYDARRRELEREIADAKAELDAVRASRKEIATRQRVWNDWLELAEMERRLETALPVVDSFPEDGVARLETLEARRAERREQVEKARRDLERADGELRSLVADEVLLAAALRIAELAERRGAYARALEDRASDGRALAAVKAELATVLARLGPDWTIERVRGVDRSLFTRDAIAQFESLIGTTARAVERAHDREVERIRERDRVAEELRHAETRAASAGGTATDDDRARARRLREAFRDRERLRARREISEQQASLEHASDNKRTALSLYIPLGLAVLGLAAGAVLFVLGRPVDGAIAAAVLLLIAFVVWVTGRAKGGDAGGARAAADAFRVEEEAATAAIAREWSAAGLAGEPSEEALETHVRELDRRDALRGEAERQLEQHRDRLARADQAVLLAANERERETHSAADAQSAWSDWLAERGFPGGLQPSTARDALAALDECARLAAERDRLTVAVEASETIVAEFEADIGALCDGTGRARPEPGSAVGFLQTLEADAESARKIAALRDQAARQRAAAESDVELARAGHDAADAEIAELLAAGAAADAEVFRLRGRLFAERRELRDRIAARIAGLSTATGVADREAIGRVFAGDTPEALEAESERLARHEEALDDRYDALVRERAEVAHALERLASADTVARLRGEEERLRERIRQSALVWSRNAVARFLLDEAKRRFEAERQPGVLREAARFFRTITGGRYVNVVAPTDGGEIEVVEEGGARKPAEVLSRGAKEQLYLAIRFGYVATSREGGERLPVVMDDILVNSDAARRSAAVAGILEIAEHQQVLYFTCHEETIASFRALRPGVPVVRLAGGRIERSDG